MNSRHKDNHIIQYLRNKALLCEEIVIAEPAMREAMIFAFVLENMPIFYLPGDIIVGDFGWRVENADVIDRDYPEIKYLHTEHVETPASRLFDDFHCFGGYAAAHTCIDYDKLLRLGIDGILAEINNSNSGEYGQAMSVSLRALLILAERYALMLENSGEHELAAICRKVPRQPAGKFYEALQSIWFAHLAIGISEYSDASISLGRLDQYALTHYCNSITAGVTAKELDDQFAALIKKLNCYGDAACAVNIGGINNDGADLCNDLSRLIVRVVRNQQQPAPILAARIHQDFPQDLFDELIDPQLFAVGQPTFYGEYPCRSALRTRGVPEIELSQWAANSCMGLIIEGSEVSNMWGGVINFLLPLEMCVNNGNPLLKPPPVEIISSAKSCYESFDELLNQFWRYLVEITGFCIQQSKDGTAYYRRERPNPYLSSFLNLCIERGKDRLDGGVKYHTTIIEAFGLVNAADALYAIKNLVFETGKYRLDELTTAAMANFSGLEKILQDIRELSKYGNGNTEMDEFAAKIADKFQHIVRGYSTSDESFAPSFHTLNAHVGAGKKYGASLDGRLAGEPLAKNIGPSPGTAMEGPTALIQSAVAFDQKPYFGGQALDISIDASMVESMPQKHNIQSLIQTYFNLGGLQIQVNGLTADTLWKAIDTPEAYRDLIVRIGGYSDYFNNLTIDTRQEMAMRMYKGL